MISSTRVAWGKMLNRAKGQLKSRTFLGPNCLDQKRAHDWPSKENGKGRKPSFDIKREIKTKVRDWSLVDVQENGVGHPRV